jgi:hypothetical protein
MKALGTKLVFSAVGIALLASPAFAQRPRHYAAPRSPYYDYAASRANPVGVYPNPVGVSGSAESIQSGAAFDLDRGE